MNLASDVPPDVESSGVIPVFDFIAFSTIAEKSLGKVKKLSPDTLKIEENLILNSFSIIFISLNYQFFNVPDECKSLKRILIVAVVSAGITLLALFPVSIVVTDKLDGSKYSFP